jgi:RHS repeat-associated protein
MENVSYCPAVKKINKYISVLLTAVILISVFSVAFYANALGTYTLSYTLSADGTYYTVSGITVSGGNVNVEIPETYNSHPVTKIGDRAFDDCSSMLSIVIPDTVTDIGAYAFDSCSALTEITLPSNVTTLGSYAFCRSGLTSMTIPSTVTGIGTDLFYNCKHLTSVNIQSPITKIPDHTFDSCSALTSVTYPSSVTTIGNYAFDSCTSLTQYTIPSNVTTLGTFAFCRSGLTSMTIPSTVTSIGTDLFYNCKHLTSVNIQSPITKIPDHTFDSCSALTNVTYPSNVTTIGNYAFDSCTSLTQYTIPSNVTTLGTFAFCRSGLTSMTIPSTVTGIGTDLFYNCKQLTSVNIQSPITKIPDHTFDSCSALTSVTYPSSVTTIGNYAFDSCTSLTQYTIPSNVTTLGTFAFCRSGLTSMTIPSTVTSIGTELFYNCKQLTSVNIQSPIIVLPDWIFDSCSSLQNVNLPDTLREIGDKAFYGCTSLSDLTIPSGVTTINDYALYNCSSLKRLLIPSSVTAINGNYPFRSCFAGSADIYYQGTSAQWSAISMTSAARTALESKTVHYQTAAPVIFTVSGNPTSWTGSSATLKVNGAADSDSLAALPYSFSSSEGTYDWQASDQKLINENGTVYIYVKDSLNNIALVSTENITKIDKTMPGSSDVTGNPDSYSTSGSVVLTVNGASDTGSGLADKPYSFSTAPGFYIWQSSNVSPVFTSGRTIYVYVRDNAGNIYLAGTQNISIDTQSPTVSGVSSSASGWSSQPITLTVNGAADSGCGLNAQPYSFSTEPGVYNWQSSNVSQAYTADQPIYVYVRDALGNIGLATVIYSNSDGEVPVISSVSGTSETQTTEPVTLVVRATDGSGCGLADEAYSFSDTQGTYNWQSANYKSFSSNQTVYIYVRDKAGNISAVNTAVINNISGTAADNITDPAASDDYILKAGKYTESDTDFTTDKYRDLPAFGFSRYYDQNNAAWFFSVNSCVAAVNGSTSLSVTMPDGNNYVLNKINSMIYKNSGSGYVLQKAGAGYIMYADDLIYGFAADGKLSYISDKYSDTMTFTRTGSSVTVSSGSGYTYVAQLDASGRVTSVTNADGSKIYASYSYDTDGKLVTVTNASGETAFSYTYTNGLITKSNDKTIVYADGRISSETLDNGSSTAYTYDLTNRKTTIYTVNADGTQTLSSETVYDSKMNILSQTDGNSNTQTYTYYDDGTQHTYVSGNINDTYDERGNLISGTENGTAVTYTNVYDTDGNLISVTSSNNKTRLYTYADGYLVRSKEANGAYTYYVYDVYGNVLVTAVLKSGYTGTAPDTYTYGNDIFNITVNIYDSTYYSELNEVIDTAEGTDEKYNRDTYGNTVSTISTAKDGTVTTVTDTYDQFGKITGTTDGTNSSSKDYDDSGRMLRQSENGETARYIYDSHGRLIQQIDPEDYDSTKDGLNAAVPVNTYSDSNAGQRYSYGANGNLISETDRNGKTTTYTYYSNGKVSVKTFDIYTVNYTQSGNISSIYVGTQLLVSYSYDSQDRLAAINYSNGQSIRYIYGTDASGNETKSVYYNKEATARYIYTFSSGNDSYAIKDNVNHREFAYIPYSQEDGISSDGYMAGHGDMSDSSNARIYTEMENPDGCDGTNAFLEFFGYGSKVFLAGSMYFDETALSEGLKADVTAIEKAVDMNVSKIDETVMYSGVKSLAENTVAFMIVTFYSEDASGNITASKTFVADPRGSSTDVTFTQLTSYTYSDKKISSETHQLSNASISVSYTYDSKGNILSETRNGAGIYYTYDSTSQLTRCDDQNTGLTTVYTYDNRGNILSKTQYSYTRDSVSGLTPVSTDSYTYANGNWWDELTSYNGNAVTYDSCGNVISFNGRTFTWEGGRILSSVTNSDGTHITYKYDVDGIRTSKTVNGVTTQFNTVDGRITSTYNGTDLIYFTYDSNEHLSSITINDVTYLYVTDYLGDVIAITDRNGNMVVEYTYDEWGNTTSITGSMAGSVGAKNPMRYRGYYYDAETGYYYLQSRYYDTGIGRFINADDAEFISKGDKIGTNVFEYCSNNPITKTDASGNSYSFLGFGLQVSFSFGPISAGFEFVWFTNRRVSIWGMSRKEPLIYSFGLLNPMNLIKDIVAYKFRPDSFFCGTSGSLSFFMIYGDSGKFKNALNYEGTSICVSTVIHHVCVSFSSCKPKIHFELGLGYSTEPLFSVSVNLNTYTLWNGSHGKLSNIRNYVLKMARKAKQT